MPLFTVDESKCKRDGFCAAECPIGIIEFKNDGSVPRPVEDAASRCIGCGHCVSVCPHEAIRLAAFGPQDCVPVNKSLALTKEHAEHFLRSRRSIRNYKDKDVPRETLEELVRIASHAPTGSNSQQVGWLVAPTREAVRKLAGLGIDWMRYHVKKDSQFARAYRMAQIAEAWDNGVDIICRGAAALVIAHAPKEYPAGVTDCTIALSHIDLAAPSYGLGTCWAGFMMIAAGSWPALRDALDIPEGRVPYGMMMVGYPKYEYHRMPPRKAPKITWQE